MFLCPFWIKEQPSTKPSTIIEQYGKKRIENRKKSGSSELVRYLFNHKSFAGIFSQMLEKISSKTSDG